MIPFPFPAGLHVDAVNSLAVGGIGKPDGQPARIILGLCDAFGQGLVPRLGFNHSQIRVAVFQHIIGGQCLAPPAVPLDTAKRDRMFPPDAAAFNHAPAGPGKCGVDMFGSGFGFIHRFYVS